MSKLYWKKHTLYLCYAKLGLNVRNFLKFLQYSTVTYSINTMAWFNLGCSSTELIAREGKTRQLTNCLGLYIDFSHSGNTYRCSKWCDRGRFTAQKKLRLHMQYEKIVFPSYVVYRTAATTRYDTRKELNAFSLGQNIKHLYSPQNGHPYPGQGEAPLSLPPHA